MSYTIEHSTWIDREPQAVFDFATNTGRWPSYIPGVISAEAASSRVERGAKFTLTMSNLGQRFDVEGAYLAVEPGVSFHSRAEAGPMISETLTNFVAENGGTRVERVQKLDAKGFFRLAEPLLKRRTQRDVEVELANLKDLLEAELKEGLQAD